MTNPYREAFYTMKNIALLGSTGSIGKNTLEVVRNNPDKLKIISLTAGKNWQLLAEQAREFKPSFVALADTKYENDLKQALKDTDIKVQNAIDRAHILKDNFMYISEKGFKKRQTFFKNYFCARRPDNSDADDQK